MVILLCKIWRRQDAQVSPASGNNGIDFVTCGKIASNHRWNTRLIAHLVTQRRQETATVGQFALDYRLACQHLNHITSMLLQQFDSLYRVLN